MWKIQWKRRKEYVLESCKWSRCQAQEKVSWLCVQSTKSPLPKSSLGPMPQPKGHEYEVPYGNWIQAWQQCLSTSCLASEVREQDPLPGTPARRHKQTAISTVLCCQGCKKNNKQDLRKLRKPNRRRCNKSLTKDKHKHTWILNLFHTINRNIFGHWKFLHY